MTCADSMDIGCSPFGGEPFMRETDYRWARFCAWCGQLNGKRVAFYGSGANARRILNASDAGLSISAVVDDHAVGKEVCGFAAEAMTDELLREIDCIVVAAEFKSALVIAKRIADDCANSGVELRDMYGNDLSAIMSELGQLVSQTLAEQLKAIDQSNALCVNIDVFTSERSAKSIAECVADGSGLDRCIASVAEYAIASGKHIVFYSLDATLGREAADAILAQAGLSGAHSIQLASEHGLWAENGLFRRMYCDAGSDSVLHIGSDLLRDGFIPLCYGMPSILTGFVTVPDCLWSGQEESRSAHDRVWYHDAPQTPGDAPEELLRQSIAEIIPTVHEAEGERIGGIVSIVAPLVIGYLTWLIDHLRNEPGRFERVLFASRDAYIVSKAYDIVRECCGGGELPEPLYFYTSRKASLEASLQDQTSSDARRNALRYFRDNGLELGKRYAFVEFVGAATCQLQLERFAPFALTGFYFGSRAGDLLSRYVDCRLYFTEEDTHLLSRYLRLEPYLSSDEPSLVGYEADGRPVFAQEYRTDAELARLHAVHEGILLCVRAYFSQRYRAGDVIDHRYVNRIAAGLDAYDDELMSLYDDLSGRKLTKQVGDVPASDDAASSACTSRTTRDALLGLLAAFDAVCREFDLHYIATHGTLLGAVRNGGFVPGDDDLDIAMPRADYDTLLELAEKGVFPEPFYLQAPENDSASFYGGYAKLRDTSAVASELEGGVGSDEFELGKGVWMDIMPLDDCPAQDAALLRQRKIVRVWQRALHAKTYGIHHLWGVDPYKMSAYYAIGDKLSRESLCKHLRKACTSSKPTGFLTIFAGNYIGKRATIRFRASDVANAKRTAFEGTTIPIPAHAEEWLEAYYGADWETATD